MSIHVDELTQLNQAYGPQGLEILLFPCNQFNDQEPGTLEEIKAFWKDKSPPGDPTWHIFTRVDVNGEKAHPLWVYLKAEQGGALGFDDIKWNYAKFLVDRQGNVVSRFAPVETPLSFEAQIRGLL